MKFLRAWNFFAAILILFSLNTICSAATWNEIVSYSANNDDLASASKQLDSSQWSYYKSYSPMLPQVSLSASYSEVPGVGTAETSKSYSTGLNVSQNLFNGFQNYNNMRSAFANYQQTIASYNKTKSDVLYQIRTAYIGLYMAQENLILSKKILTQLHGNARMIKLRYDSGREDKGNLLSTLASERDGEYSVASAKRELELAKLKLSQLCSAEITSADDLPTLTGEASTDFNFLTENSPTYIISKYQLESYEIAAQKSISGFLPTVNLSGSVRNSGDTWPPSNQNTSWGLSASYSLFPGGSNIAEKFINDLNLDKAKRDFSSAKKDLIYSIEDTYRRLKDAYETLDVRQFYLEASIARAKISDAKYVNGLITYDEWNRITNDNISAQKSFLNTRKSVFEASAAWKNVYGGWEK